jgi:amino-acid N-acetyltransferase
VPAIRELLAVDRLPLDGVDDRVPTTIVARANGRVIGCAALELYEEGALLRSVVVDASARGQGLGVALTRAAVDLAGRSGAAAVYLLTTTAERFFPRLGFAAISRDDVPASVRQSVEFTSACPASAAVMRCTLPTANAAARR